MLMSSKYPSLPRQHPSPLAFEAMVVNTPSPETMKQRIPMLVVASIVVERIHAHRSEYNPEESTPYKFLAPAVEKMKEYAAQKMRLFAGQ